MLVLDQTMKRRFDFADPGELSFGLAELVGDIGNLPLERLKRHGLWGIERIGDLPANGVDPRVQGIERIRRHRSFDRVLKPVRHLHQAVAEIAVRLGLRRVR